ncbi:MAG: GTPase HflX [Chromatiales bacterium]
MFERPSGGERAVLVHVAFQSRPDPGEIDEFTELVKSAGAEPVAFVTASRSQPDPGSFVGSGKLEEIRGILEAESGELVIFDHELSPRQERNIEQALSCRVLDRTGLILDIFAQRAQSHEGKLQVELAQLRHLSTRLVRGWTHLERQKGGIGLRGPGETQLETDRRLIGQRISRIRKRLEKVDARRELGRKARYRAEVPTLSLVGYTNAGKSTLFNRLTESQVYAKDQLFATLDPTLRQLVLPGNTGVVLADTVGFISRLPHELVAAFRSTLQESIDATLLLHVIDASSPEMAGQVAEVRSVLEEIGATGVPLLEVYNKIDRLDGVEPHVERNGEGKPLRVWLSAMQGTGLDMLLEVLEELVGPDRVSGSLVLAPDQGALRAALYREGHVDEESFSDDGSLELHVTLPRKRYEQLVNEFEALKRLQTESSGLERVSVSGGR